MNTKEFENINESMKDSIPHFIIVGAMKSGSTSLLQHLRNHKKIYAPSSEVHFFNKDENFEKGVEWYRDVLLAGCNEDILAIGEKTPTYSFQENVPGRIFKLFPNTKLIWIFRNPVDRTYSNYLHAYKNGVDNLSFDKAMDREADRVKEYIFYGYKRRSIYHEQVSRFLELFPKENMFFLLFEDLILPYSDDHILNDLFKFLELSPAGFTFKEEPRNITTLPKYPMLLYNARKLMLYKSRVFKILIKRIAYFNAKPGYPKLSHELRRELVEYFKPHNAKLSKIIGRDLTIWDK